MIMFDFVNYYTIKSVCMANFFAPAASYFPLGFTIKISEIQKFRACGAQLAIASLG